MRKGIAEEEQVPPFVVFSDKTLHEMCRCYPITLTDMRKTSGVGDSKLKRYGDAFVSEIKRYLSENPGIIISERQAVSIDRPRTSEKKTGETVEKTYRLLTKGMSMEEIARERNLAQSTIATHIEKLILEGRGIEIDNLIDPKKRRMIEELFSTTKHWNLGPVVEQFNDLVTYEEAKLVRAWMSKGG